MKFPAAKDLNFNLDKHLEPLIPRSRLDRLPRPLSHFLGYRATPRQPIGNILVALWAAFGGFCGTAILSGLFMSSFIKDRGGPIIIASYGAAAILEYNAIESPFSQPRNALCGQLLASVIGVCITKLFALSASFEQLRWLASALSVGLCSAVMTLTNTVHPPAGATALLAAVQPEVSGLGWLYIGIVVLSSALTLVVSLLVNNLQRQYPMYWWSPRREEAGASTKDMKEDLEGAGKHCESAEAQFAWDRGRLRQDIVVAPRGILLPDGLYLTDEERDVLLVLHARLKGEQVQEGCMDAGTLQRSTTRTDTSSDSGLSQEWKSDHGKG